LRVKPNLALRIGKKEEFAGEITIVGELQPTR